MADISKAIQALKESRPPATDTFTYLTIIGEFLSPEVLPTLHEILQDPQITQDIGWDLVEMLIPLQGSEQCLETIAQLGTPREVILKVLEVLEATMNTADDEEDAETTKKFITLVGMLGILHKRLTVKVPSRFVHTTLQTVYQAYRPHNPEMTAAIIALVRSLSGEKRPILPTRKSSTRLEGPFLVSDPTKNAPDPEAEQTETPEPREPAMIKRLLQSFITCIIEACANCSNMGWASRLLEFYNPERVVPGKSMLRAFKEDADLLARDALAGQLVALAGDLGMSKVPSLSIKDVFESPIITDPLSTEIDSAHPEAVRLSTGGVWCLIAYWLFASEVFDGDYDQVEMTIFPYHYRLLKRFLDADDPQTQIANNPGTSEALLVMGLWLDNYNRMSVKETEPEDFMGYHHLLTLISVFHPSVQVRNVATTLAGLILHADPDAGSRLKILEDLLENCIFASLQASSVSWLREEIIIAHKRNLNNQFSNPEAIEALQYSLFPNIVSLKDENLEGMWEHWVQNYPFHLQVANFAYFLLSGTDYKHVVPTGMGSAVEERYVRPLLHVAKVLRAAIEKKEIPTHGMENEVIMQLDILTLRLESLHLS